jgi:uncharacterized protein (DUF1330 family)
MSATLIVRHSVTDYATWRAVYDSVGPLQAKHGVTSSQVLQLPGDANDVTVVHNFATVAQAEGLANDPELKSAMQQGGVAGPPRIEIFVGV